VCRYGCGCGFFAWVWVFRMVAGVVCVLFVLYFIWAEPGASVQTPGQLEGLIL